MMNRAVFLDRDGTINEHNKSYVTKWSEFKFLPNSLEALNLLAESGYKIIIITNQSGIGRGLIPQESVEDIHSYMLAHVEGAGGRIDAIYVCMHHPDDGCECRKPKIGLINLARETFNLSLKDSWFVGDNTMDIQTGTNITCKTILVETGYGGRDGLYGIKPDYQAKDLLEAVKIILH